MTPQQVATLCHAIRDALDAADSDRATALAYLGTRMCEAPNAELWTRIEHYAELVAE